MTFLVNIFSIFSLIVIFLAKYVEPYRQPTDCSTIITSNGIRFLGCKEKATTQSLSKRKVSRKTIYSFKGIPFAEPPVGALRFRKPIAKVHKKEALVDARRYQTPCMQPWIVEKPFGVMSEDCLYLNIWTPSVSTGSNLPVMVWMYGGAFTLGSGSQLGAAFLSTDNIFLGTHLSLREVVVITLNYRLGVFGFLYGNTSDCPGNQGLWDQSLAIKWVKTNVRAFGGNPNDITLFGESAGSMSISNHIVSNFTRNLFQKAIMQSGSAYTKLFSRDKEYSYGIARRFATNKNLFITGGCAQDGRQWIDCLREKSAFELLKAQVMGMFLNPSKPWYTGLIQEFTPIFGDEYVPISINKAVKEGNFKNDIKLLMGHNEMEGLFFASAFDVLKGLQGRYIPFLPIEPVISKEIVFNDIRQYFFDNDTIGLGIAEDFTKGFSKDNRLIDSNGIRRSAVHSFGDYFLACPTILFGGHLVRNLDFKGVVYQYRLTYAHKQSIGRYSVWGDVTHTDDVALVFGAPFTDPLLWGEDDRRLSRVFMDVWTYFAKYGRVPKVNGNVWPEYSLRSDHSVNASYLELHASSDRLGRVLTDRYQLNTLERTAFIGDCFYYWDSILSGHFGETNKIGHGHLLKHKH